MSTMVHIKKKAIASYLEQPRHGWGNYRILCRMLSTVSGFRSVIVTDVGAPCTATASAGMPHPASRPQFQHVLSPQSFHHGRGGQPLRHHEGGAPYAQPGGVLQGGLAEGIVCVFDWLFQEKGTKGSSTWENECASVQEKA